MGDVPKPPGPDWLIELLGGDWPEGSETGMRELAEVWDRAADDLETIKGDASTALEDLLSHIEAQSKEPMRTSMNELIIDDEGLPAQIADCRALAQMCRDYADQLERIKWTIYGAIGEAIASGILGLAGGIFGAGAVLVKTAAKRLAINAAIKGAIAAVKASARSMVSKTAVRHAPRIAAKEAARESATEAAIATGADLAAGADGSTQGMSGKYILDSAVGGAAYGAGSGGFRGLTGGRGFMSNTAGGMVGATTSSAANLEAPGGMDIAGGALGGALGSHHHGTAGSGTSPGSTANPGSGPDVTGIGPAATGDGSASGPAGGPGGPGPSGGQTVSPGGAGPGTAGPGPASEGNAYAGDPGGPGPVAGEAATPVDPGGPGSVVGDSSAAGDALGANAGGAGSGAPGGDGAGTAGEGAGAGGGSGHGPGAGDVVSVGDGSGGADSTGAGDAAGPPEAAASGEATGSGEAASGGEPAAGGESSGGSQASSTPTAGEGPSGANSPPGSLPNGDHLNGLDLGGAGAESSSTSSNSITDAAGPSGDTGSPGSSIPGESSGATNGGTGGEPVSSGPSGESGTTNAAAGGEQGGPDHGGGMAAVPPVSGATAGSAGAGGSSSPASSSAAKGPHGTGEAGTGGRPEPGAAEPGGSDDPAPGGESVNAEGTEHYATGADPVGEHSDAGGDHAPDAGDTITNRGVSTADAPGQATGPARSPGGLPTADHQATSVAPATVADSADSATERTRVSIESGLPEGDHLAGLDLPQDRPGAEEATPTDPDDVDTTDCAYNALDSLSERHPDLDLNPPGARGDGPMPAGDLFTAAGLTPDLHVRPDATDARHDPEATPEAYQAIEDRLRAMGDGSSALVASGWTSGTATGGHAYLAHNNNGHVEFTDPTNGEQGVSDGLCELIPRRNHERYGC